MARSISSTQGKVSDDKVHDENSTTGVIYDENSTIAVIYRPYNKEKPRFIPSPDPPEFLTSFSSEVVSTLDLSSQTYTELDAKIGRDTQRLGCFHS
jgi:hypothetical protein